MAEVSWTASALTDLDKITDYYAQEHPKYGQTLADEIMKRTKQLILFPKSGRIVSELSESGVRELIYRNYRIVYWHDEEDDKVEIWTVFHFSRQFGGSEGSIEE
ncbi:MAG: type II toxin-antitoxin system RelE/ParE family toxin [Rhizobacter sp.]|nr:type II toxin-antitoxin system RelE/ParE family toxin [Chlorobiales bacterium]